jgi:hypothetical protein
VGLSPSAEKEEHGLERQPGRLAQFRHTVITNLGGQVF